MAVSRLALASIIVLLAIIVLAGFLFLQNEITGLNANSPTPTPTAIVTTNPSPTPTVTAPTAQPQASPAASSTPTTTSYGGTTLVCVGSLSYGSDGGPIFVINSLQITNTGSENATVSALLIKTYNPDGSPAGQVTKYLDASGVYFSPGLHYTPFVITPGQTLTNPFSGRDDSREVYGVLSAGNTLASYTITPIN